MKLDTTTFAFGYNYFFKLDIIFLNSDITTFGYTQTLLFFKTQTSLPLAIHKYYWKFYWTGSGIIYIFTSTNYYYIEKHLIYIFTPFNKLHFCIEKQYHWSSQEYGWENSVFWVYLIFIFFILYTIDFTKKIFHFQLFLIFSFYTSIIVFSKKKKMKSGTLRP